MNQKYPLLLLILGITSATAASTTYNVDPDHTHPSFEVDHFGGVSIWRGTFKKTTGTVQIDTAAKTGTVDVIIDTATIDFAHDKLNEHVSSSEMLDVAKYPTEEYKGKFVEFVDAAPKTISGDADASGTFNRADFGVNYGQQYGFKQDVLLRIQVEGIKVN
jgi:polyisoprenoid-binding protein YceI